MQFHLGELRRDHFRGSIRGTVVDDDGFHSAFKFLSKRRGNRLFEVVPAIARRDDNGSFH